MHRLERARARPRACARAPPPPPPPSPPSPSKQAAMQDQQLGLLLAVSSSIFIGSSFIIKKRGLRKAGAAGTRAGERPSASGPGGGEGGGVCPAAAKCL